MELDDGDESRWTLWDAVSHAAVSGALHQLIGIASAASVAVWVAAEPRRRRRRQLAAHITTDGRERVNHSTNGHSTNGHSNGYTDHHDDHGTHNGGHHVTTDSDSDSGNYDDDDSSSRLCDPIGEKRRLAAPVLPYELLAQVFRAAALTTLAISSTLPDTLLVGYAFALGLVRLCGGPRWQVFVRRQRNLVVALSIVVLALEHVAPCGRSDTECDPISLPRIGTALLVLSGVVGINTPVTRAEGGVPEEKASWFSRWMAYAWIDPLMLRGLLGAVHTVHDLPPLPAYEQPDACFDAVKRAQKKGGEDNMARTLWYFSRWHLTACGCCMAIAYLFDALTPVGLYGLLHDLGEPEDAVLRPWVWLVVMFVAGMGRSLFMNASLFFTQRNGIGLKTGFTMELHSRAMRCLEDDEADSDPNATADEKSAAATTRTGRISNLMAADLDSLWRLRTSLELMVGILPGTILSVAWMLFVLGRAAVPGAIIVILIMPAAAFLAKKIKSGRNTARTAQDARISAVGEFLTSIRAVKYFAWEDVVVWRTTAHRKVEQEAIWSVSHLKRAMSVIADMLPFTAIILMFFIDGFVEGNPLTAAKAYTTIFLIKRLRQYYGKVPNLTMQLMGVKVALERLDRYFASTKPREKVATGPLRIQGGQFLIGSAEAGKGFILDDISIDFVQGGLNVVTGVSGSGKTVLLLSILGETRRLAGSMSKPSDIAFASQTPWVRRGAIQDSILFFSPMQDARYAAVLDACCLGPDLATMPYGDQTMIGEGGTGLSGGQRARVALARALYSRAPLILLDDVFSALDTRTAAAVWERCFCSDLLKGRTVVLVSQVPWMSSQADLAIAMDRGRAAKVEQNIGVVRRPMTLREAKQLTHGGVQGGDGNDGDRTRSNDTNNDTDTETETGTETETESGSGAVTPMPPMAGLPKQKMDISNEAMIQEEVGESGSTSRWTVFQYVGYLGSPAYIAMIGVLLVLAQAVWFSQTLWVSYWVDQPTSEKLAHMGFYLFVYALVALGEPCVRFCFQYALDSGAWYAARRLHLDLVQAVTRTTLAWHARIPVGRIVNRFARDMMTIDWELRPILESLFGESIAFVFRVGAVVSVLPVFAIPCAALCLVGSLVSETFSRTVVVLRRIESSAQSPVFSIFQDSLEGLVVIRGHAHGPRATAKELSEALKLASSSRATNLLANRWLGVRVGFLVALVMVSAGAIAIAKSSTVAAGLIGLALTNAISMNGTVFEIILQMTALQLEMQKFERVQEYTNLPPEEKPEEYADTKDDQSLESWPEQGTVEFKNVCVKYTPDGPDILHDINLVLKAGERIAIVGRTGSGKSTLALTLLRFTHLSAGQVLLSGRDITTLPRRKLRDSVALIPQEPVLLAGTVAWNLNPTGTVSPEALATAVRSCSEVGTRSMDGWADPDARIGPAGENLSHGQRQVLALCRALARQSKLVVLDEATANMDYETDKGIQRVLRREVQGGGGRTLVTIAHRLRTIVDYDKIVVMGAGRVIEVGSPRELYESGGTFYDMVHHSGEAAGLEEALTGRGAAAAVTTASI